jgi:hypothetical protein
MAVARCSLMDRLNKKSPGGSCSGTHPAPTERVHTAHGLHTAVSKSLLAAEGQGTHLSRACFTCPHVFPEPVRAQKSSTKVEFRTVLPRILKFPFFCSWTCNKKGADSLKFCGCHPVRFSRSLISIHKIYTIKTRVQLANLRWSISKNRIENGTFPDLVMVYGWWKCMFVCWFLTGIDSPNCVHHWVNVE